MRLLHALHNSLPLMCGYSIRSGYIVRTQKSGGFEPMVVTSAQHPNGDSLREEVDGVEHRRTPPYRGRSWPGWREQQIMKHLERTLQRAVDEFHPALIHAHSPVLVGLPALRVARRNRLPLVYEIRDLWENASVDRGKFREGSILYRIAKALESRVLARADAVVAICETLRNELAPRAGNPAKVHVVPNGVDVEAFAPRPPSAEMRRRHGLDGRRLILYAGTFQPYEGLGLLVRALPRVLDHIPNAHLLVVGGSASLAYKGGSIQGTQEEILNNLVDDLGLGHRVTFTGRVPHAEIPDLFSIADVVTYPRVLTRTTALTTPLKPLEAMASARPVIVSDVPAMKELLVDGETGITFPAGDVEALAARCVDVLSDGERAARLGRAARDFVTAERRWTQLVGRYGSIYDTVLDQRGVGARAATADRWKR